MSIRSFARNLFPPLDNPELRIRRRSRTDPTLLNNSEMAAEGNSDLPVPDLRTMEELCQPSLNGRGGPITPIAIQETNFELKNDMIQQVQNSCQFHSLPGDDANKHLYKFLHVTQSIKVNEVTNDALCLYLFPHSLTHHATTWFDRLPRNSINTFEQMAKMFLGKYFPPSMVNKLRNEITNFRQRPDESLFEAWEPTVGNTQNIYAAGAYQGPTIPTTSSSLLPVVERETEATKDTMHSANNGSTKDVQPLVVPTESPILTFELVVAPINEHVASPMLCDKANDQREEFFQIFKDLNFNISFADALIMMPKFGPSIKSFVTNKDKLCELARTPLNEHCSMILLNKLPEKLGDPGKFLILCAFPRMVECLALADLGASINLMPLSMWNKLSLPNLSPMCMTLELDGRSISRPVRVAKDVFVKVGTFHFLSDFVVVDFDADPRVPLILGRSFIKTGRAFIDFIKMNTASSSGLGTLPSNTITNPKEDLKGITTRSGTAYRGPTIATTSSSLPPVVERKTEATKDMVHPANNRSTKDVQPLVFQTKSPILNSEPVIFPIIEPIANPVSALKPNQRPLIPYPSRLHDQMLRDKANDQRVEFFQIFKDLNFNISFSDALIMMPKFGPSIKSFVTNKDKLCELARTPLNEHCSMILLNKLPEKLGDPGKFLILCAFPRMVECLALADLGASINLMPLSMWNKLSLPNLSPMCMTLELDGRSISCSTSRYSTNYNDMTANRIDVIDMACEEYSQEVIGFSNVIASGNPNLPPHLEYAFLEGDDKLPVIITKDLSVEEKTALITILKSHKRAIAWKLSNIKGIDPRFCTHKILMEEEFELAVQHQRRVNPKSHDVIKNEVLKFLDAGLIYPISDSPWVSPVHCVPKKGGFIVVENEKNELILTRLVTG
nr:reverse transcriptase domain-containing protein [Tanacetum cinerariifolium]